MVLTIAIVNSIIAYSHGRGRGHASQPQSARVSELYTNLRRIFGVDGCVAEMVWLDFVYDFVYNSYRYTVAEW